MDRRLIAFAPLLFVVACKNEPKVQPIKETPPPVAASSQAVAAGKKRFAIAPEGKVFVTIDAPLEKFKGDTKKMSGVLDVDVGNLKASTGEIIADLDPFVTYTFADKDQNDTQTEHVHNWFELGEKVEPAMRADYRMARFTIETIDEASAPSVAAAKEENGVRKVHLKATGQLRVHGRSSKKTVEVDVSFKGPPEAPTEIAFKTTTPVVASLSEHDVKPRDLTGQFLAGALEKVGKKIDDKAQIDVEGKATPKG